MLSDVSIFTYWIWKIIEVMGTVPIMYLFSVVVGYFVVVACVASSWKRIDKKMPF